MASQKTLREIALETNKTNPSQLGDPVSLKAETSNNSPTPQEGGAAASSQRSSAIKDDLRRIAPAPTEGDMDKANEGKGGRQILRQKAIQKLEENPSQLGDLVSLKAETADSEPTDQHRGAASKGGKSKL